MLWTGDVLHGPLIGGKKTYLVEFLDDHSPVRRRGHRWGWIEDSPLHLEVAFGSARSTAPRPAGHWPTWITARVLSMRRVRGDLREAGASGSPARRGSPARGRGTDRTVSRRCDRQFLVEISPAASPPRPARTCNPGADLLAGSPPGSSTSTTPGSTPRPGPRRWPGGARAHPVLPRRPAGCRVLVGPALRTVAWRVATVKFQRNLYRTAPELALQAVTIRYSPIDLTER